MSFIIDVWPGSQYTSEEGIEIAYWHEMGYATRAKFFCSLYTVIREEYSEVLNKLGGVTFYFLKTHVQFLFWPHSTVYQFRKFF